MSPVGNKLLLFWKCFVLPCHIIFGLIPKVLGFKGPIVCVIILLCFDYSFFSNSFLIHVHGCILLHNIQTKYIFCSIIGCVPRLKHLPVLARFFPDNLFINAEHEALW